MTVPTVTVTGTYLNADDSPASGQVSFRLNTNLLDSDGDVIVTRATITATLDADGSFSQELAATSGDDIEPTSGVVYTVTEQIQGTSRRTYRVALPDTDPTVDLADLLPADETELGWTIPAASPTLVHTTGNETVAGIKTFTSDPIIPDEVFGAGWNGLLEPPTKNAVFDRLQQIAYNIKDFGAVGDGSTDDTAAISNTINAAPDGAVVFFPSGTYVCGHKTITGRSGLTFRGDGGWVSILKLPDATTSAVPFSFEECNDIVVEGLGYDANGIDQYGGLVNVLECNRVTVRSCRFFDSDTKALNGLDRYAFVARNSTTPNTDIVFEANIVDELQVEVDTVRRARIANNHFTNGIYTTSLALFSIVAAGHVEAVEIVGNVFDDCEGTSGPIHVGAEGPGITSSVFESILIANNVIRWTSAVSVDGIRVGNLSGSPGSGCTYRNIVISGNTIHLADALTASGSAAIWLYQPEALGDTSTFVRCLVTGNTIRVPGMGGIDVRAFSDGCIADNIVVTSGAVTGINLGTGARSLIADNVVVGTAGTAIGLGGTSGGGNRIEGNLVSGFPTSLGGTAASTDIAFRSALPDGGTANDVVPGLYHGTPISGVGTGSAAEAAMYLSPIVVPRTTTFDRIGVVVTVAGTAGAVLRLGIYRSTNDAPGPLVLDAGTVNAESTGVKEITISQSLTPGRYWLAGVIQGGAGTRPTVYTNANGGFTQAIPDISNLMARGWLRTSVAGALPASAGASATDDTVGPRVMIRASA